MQKEKIRVYILARELNIDTKILLEMCKQAGFDVKNQLSSLDHEQQVALEQLVKQGSKPAAKPSTPARPVTPVVSIDDRAVKTLPPTRGPRKEPEAPVEAPAATEVAEPAPEAPPAPEPVAPAAVIPPVVAPVAPARPASPTLTPPREMRNLSGNRPLRTAPPLPPPAATPPPQAPAARAPGTEAPARPATGPTPPPAAPPRPGPGATGRVPTVPGSPRSPGHGGRPGMRRPPSPTFGHLRPVPPPPLKQQRPAPNQATPIGERILQPKQRLTPEQLRPDAKPVRPEDLIRPQAGAISAETVPDVEIEDEDGKKTSGGKKKPTVGGVAGRDARHAQRNRRAAERKTSDPVVIDHGRVKVLDKDELSAGSRKLSRLKVKARPTGPVRKDKIELEPPITVRALSEALGAKAGELLFKLRGHGAPLNTTINSTLDASMAEVIALEYGSELTLKKAADSEEVVLAGSQQPDEPQDLVPRAPIVTVMGHVDHGKTSLLDKIRRSNIVATEAGGITQVIRAWRVEHNGKPVTFLDTPGHEAFTKMRARGAQVTDIAVIVVAADDGVMPQTEEAIHHAKAAGVSLVVAINKVDMPSANIMKTRQQLYGLDVLPDDMGGDTPFVETSAATGKGIDELLEQLSIVAELKELKANPNRPAAGTVLEAMLSEGEGVRATLLVRNGTLRRGDVILCGAAYGRVRQMYDDQNRPLQEAGPSVPVRITGLDVVPHSDDPFIVLDDLAVARDLASQRQDRRDASQQKQRAPISLERLTEAKIDELKVILKADFRGSIEAIRKELEKLQHAEVGVKVLEAGIGAITETDVWLALASKEDTMIVGFNAVPDERARALAEENGIQIHEYNIIYNLTNDIRAALEGKLKPREDVVHLGRAMVRETFKISRVGTIAGCYVTQGVIRRNAKIRVIREGVVIYPPADRSASLDSLKRYKEDSSEVREGFECGIKVAGYDDIKVGDVIEAYRVEQVQRTL